MNRLQTTACLVGTLVIAAPIAPPSFAADGATAPPKGFTALFNGQDLSGWWGLKTEDPRKWKALTPEKLAEKRAASIRDLNKNWSAKDGVLYNAGSGLFLSTIKEYGDFELLVDYNMVAGGDSGIYLRGIPQVQIWDYTQEGGKWDLGADKGSGGLWNNAKDSPGKDPLVLADKPFGQWNALRIIMIGDKVTV